MGKAEAIAANPPVLKNWRRDFIVEMASLLSTEYPLNIKRGQSRPYEYVLGRFHCFSKKSGLPILLQATRENFHLGTRTGTTHRGQPATLLP